MYENNSVEQGNRKSIFQKDEINSAQNYVHLKIAKNYSEKFAHFW